MFRLAEKVGGYLPGVAASVGNHQDVAWPGDHIDAHFPEDKFKHQQITELCRRMETLPEKG
mgnify:CR=1 FL=1